MKSACIRLPYYLQQNKHSLDIPSRYILMDCLLGDLNFICPGDNNIYLYSVKGVLNQLTMFHKLTNKLFYIKYKKSLFISSQIDKLILFIFYLNNIKDNINKLIEKIYMGYNKSQLKKNYLWENINPLTMKNIPKNLTFKQQYEWKKKHLSKYKLDKLTSIFENNYKDAIKVININKNDKKLPAFKKRIIKRFKIYNFDKELKAIQHSIFYTCEVKNKLEKLFPKFK